MASILFLLLVAACLLVTLHAQEQVQVQAAVQVTAAKRQVCGTKDPSEAKLQEVRRYLHQHHASNSQLRGTMAEAVEVPVHMWVISDSSGEGDLSDSTIQQQMNILNSKFKDKGFSFTLASTGRRTNDEWFNYMLEDDEVEAEAKQALAVIGPNILNVYTVNEYEHDGLVQIGEGRFPWDYGSEPAYMDGIMVAYTTLPGISGEHMGVTLIHEVGHWLGLLHPWQGGCFGDGDFVADTPAMADYTFDCIPQDTCSSPGMDPVHNIMGYTPDSCRTLFTEGQEERMVSSWQLYRQP